MIKPVVTPKQVALAIGVSEASLKRWCDKGLLPAMRTAGGHRRLPISGVFEFLRTSGHRVVRPEVLGLPTATGNGEVTIERSREVLQAALQKGDEEQVERLVMGLYLAGYSIADICDKALAYDFRMIGHHWENGRVEVYQERRACEICHRVLTSLRAALPSPKPGAPSAIGATLDYDPYTLATVMVAMTLREIGWRAESYGTGNPAFTLCASLRAERPRIFWLSVSSIPSVDPFVEDVRQIYEAAVEVGAALVLGGRALTEPIRQRIHYSAYCDTLAHLVAFARTLDAQPGISNGSPKPSLPAPDPSRHSPS